jgi:hypothetical protein
MKNKNIKKMFLAVFVMILGLTISTFVFADEEGEGHERRERRGKSEGEGRAVIPENAAYKNECSSCHFLYPPEFLPKRSWEALMKGSDKHFGENLALDEKTSNELLSYLTENSAERGSSEWSGKILKSIGSSTPLQITETPYILKEHRKIKADVFKRKSIGSFSNCGACHTKGAEGDFEEDSVSIPKQ